MPNILSATLCSIVTLFAAQGLAAQGDAPQIPSREDAPIAYLFDLTSGQVLFAREADRRFMPASITKVMTTFLAFEWMEEGKLNPKQMITVRPEVWKKWNNVGSTMFLPNHKQVSVDDLVHGIMTVSANDGAAVLADGAGGSVSTWVGAMNAKARDIGMRDSHFGTPNGWMDEGHTFVTAEDLTTLAAEMIQRHPSKYHRYVGQNAFTYNGITQFNHDPLSGKAQGADGIKTGFTNQAGYGYLGSAQKEGRRLIFVVAASPSSSVRRHASRDLMEWGFDHFQQKQIFAPDKEIARARVQGGGSGDVALMAPHGVSLSIPRGLHPNVTLTVSYDGPLRAPITAGEEVAHLVVKIDAMPDYYVPLIAGSDVAEAGFFDRIINGIQGWFV